MSGDYSRISFDPWQDDLGVLLQQGRPLSDADWNALVMQLRRRIHAGTLDTIGTGVVPLETPDGFDIGLVTGNLTIGRGRIYVDGLLAENHGAGKRAWEPRLEESIGTELVRYAPQTGFTAQPYYPDPPALPGGGPHLVYLDVWQREVDHLVRPELIEKAVGVDSSTRLQTVWQVKVLDASNVDVLDCSTPLDKIPGWLPDHAPSGGRLSTSTAVVPGQPDPCLVPPAGGYKGLENQLYRVEIHKGGAPGTATFKWSRDNASVQTLVTHIPALDQLVVESVGRDSVLRFSDGDWIEVTDDWRELHNQPGELRRIKIGNGVDDATRTITLDAPLTAGLFPTDAQNRPQPDRHTRIKRWDQRGKVLDQAGNVLQPDLAASSGEITVPASAAVGVHLEHAIVATFSLDPAGGVFKSGDYWVFAARATDATIEELDAAPPLGIHHHYAKLAIVTFPGTFTDCRQFWPPAVTAAGESCACTVCVSPESHASGSLTLQGAVDKVREAGGGVVCLEVGTYDLAQPLLIQGARSLRIVGKGMDSRLRCALTGILIDKCQDVGLSSFSVLCRGAGTAPGSGLALRSSSSVVVEDLQIQIASNNPSWSAIDLGGALSDVVLRDNTLISALGIGSGGDANAPTGLMDVRIEDNTLACELTGLRLTGVSVHQFVSRVAGNRFFGCRKSGCELTGATVPGFGVELVGNEFQVSADAVIAGLDGLRILDNDIIHDEETAGEPHRGIVLTAGAAGEEGLSDCEIRGNRIVGFAAAGIAITAPLASVRIDQNHVEKAEFGLFFEDGVPIGTVAVDGNRFQAIGGSAIHLESDRGQLLVTGNQIETSGERPTVFIICPAGDCTFGHNQCRLLQPDVRENVVLAADSLIVPSNRTFGGAISLNLEPGLVGEQRLKCTVVGNIVTGKIVVRGAALPPPWSPINLQGV